VVKLHKVLGIFLAWSDVYFYAEKMLRMYNYANTARRDQHRAARKKCRIAPTILHFLLREAD